MTFNYKYPFIYLLTALIAGILFDLPLTAALYCFFVSIGLALSSFIFHQPTLWKEITLLGTVFSCGLVVSAPDPFQPDPTLFYSIPARCDEILPHQNYILSSGHRHYYLSHFHTDTTYKIGDSLNFKARILPLKKNANPGEFSYARYLKQKNVSYRLIPVTTVRQTGYSDNLYSYFGHIRQKLIEKNQRLFPDTTCRQLINALCLGYKNDLDNELQNLFISTGTIHLLSVSGLHTGAIYLLLLFFFKKIGCPIRKAGLYVLPVLWIYACLTGLSPSVIRAATLLSFITVGQYSNQSYTPLNSVAAAAFLTLLLRPSNLFSLSFLLSYSAYTGILTIYPFLYRYAKYFPAYLTKIYACCCITIAAQLLTLPISAYYFHTININGVLANIVAVPLATLLLYTSTICLFLPVVPGQYLALIPQTIEKILIGFLRFFEPYSLNIQNLYPHYFTILLCYPVLIFLYLYFSHPRRKWLIYSVLSISILLCWNAIFHFHLASRKEIIVFHLYQQSAILLNHKGYYTFLYNTSDTNAKMQPYIFQNHLRPLPENGGLLHTEFTYYANLLCTRRDTITIATPALIPAVQGKTLIVTHPLSPEKVFSSDRLIFPSQIILDGSHSLGQARLWEEFCRNHQVGFINTAESGSFRISLP